MNRWTQLTGTCFLGAVLAAGAPSLGAQGSDETPAALVEEVRTQLATELDDLDAFDIDRWQREVLIEHGTLDPLLIELERLEDDKSHPRARRKNAQWVRGLLLARQGDLREALDLIEDFARGSKATLEAKLEKARLLDALGRESKALKEYEEFLPEITDELLEAAVRTRVALLKMAQDSEQAGALAEFAGAEGRDPGLRNRAAVVLGLIGRPADAMELFAVNGVETKRFRQEVRVAEWAIRAGAAETAQDYAWRAVSSAKLRRDRHYGLTILVEAHRLDDSLAALVDRFAATPALDEASRSVWIDLLRELGRTDEAIALFRNATNGTFTVEDRRELLEMYRDRGDDEVMIGVFGDLIAAEPHELQWREGLSRAHLELGNRAAGVEAWRTLLDDPTAQSKWLEAAKLLADLGLDELAIETANRCFDVGEQPLPALFFLFDLHRERGRQPEAEATLQRIDDAAAPDAPERFHLAEGWERLGRLESAIESLESVRAARGPEGTAEDLEMRLAWLYSEVGEEETALERWTGLWQRLNSVSRRRYAEDRLMTIASRLGTIADIAIDLEQRLFAGTATERDSGLLVRLYTKVGDSVSATEVIDEFFAQSGGSAIDAMKEKARIFLTCNDYHDYEKTVRRLIELDPAGEGDYLRQLAMSQLERGKPHEAKAVLERLQAIEMGIESSEFEAGVLALAGLREEAVAAYRRGLAANPGRIESYLLMARLMSETGQKRRAIGMFQYLVATAERDDLFTIAIDGLLNLEAPEPVMKWARRLTLERLAARHDKMYLYQLLADLCDALEDREGMITALEGSLSISGERRPSLLRELMDLCRGGGTSFTGRGWAGDERKHLAFGRRLIGLAEVVPPQVYLDLGEAFLENGEPENAKRTFGLARDLPDYPIFQRQAAALFEGAGYRKEALETYKRVLVAQSSDVGLMVKVGELEEQAGRDAVAEGLYRRALDLLYSRLPLATAKADARSDDDPFSFYGARNVDAFDQYHDRLRSNLLVVLNDPAAADAYLQGLRDAVEADLTAIAAAATEENEKDTLAHHPRILRRSDLHRRMAIAYGRRELADALDLRLLAAFPADEDLLDTLCQVRLAWGMYGSVRRLLDGADRPAEQRDALRFLVGDGLDEDSAQRIPLHQAERLFFTPLIAGRDRDAGLLIRRTDFARIEKDDVNRIEPLFSASLFLRDHDLTLTIAREWMRQALRHGAPRYQAESLLERCKGALEPEDYRNLCFSFAAQLIAKPEQHSDLLKTLPDLQKDFEEPLVTEEQMLEILDDLDGNGTGWGLGPVVAFFPEEQRGAALRTIWSKVKPTSRTRFLLHVFESAQGELGETATEFVRGAIRGAIGDMEPDAYFAVDDVTESRFNLELGLEILDARIELMPRDLQARAGRAVQLLRLERTEEALDQALAVYKELVDDDGDDYRRRQAVEWIVEHFAPDHLPALVDVLRDEQATTGPSVQLVQRHLALLERTKDEAGATALLERAVEDFPEDQSLLRNLERRYQNAGRQEEAMEIATRLADLDPDHKRRLAQRWRRMDHPVRALEITEELRAESPDADLPPEIPGMPAGFILQPGMTLVTPAGSFTGGSGGALSQRLADRPTMEKVKQAVEAEDWPTARTTLRRLWRDFPVESPNGRGHVTYFGSGFFGGRSLTWPEEDEKGKDGAEEEKPSRGGLDSWSETDPEPEPPAMSGPEKLAEFDFGVDELRRMLRARGPYELAYATELLDGLLRARVLRDGMEATRDALIEEVAQDRVSKIETRMLLSLLDQHPELSNDAARGVLEYLLQEARPTDAVTLRALARIYVHLGNVEEARRLYTWCATRTERPGYILRGDDPTIDAGDLLREVIDQLEGEPRMQAVEAILEFADPRDFAYVRQRFEVMVLETFLDLLEPTAVVERCRKLLDQATDFREGLRRETALLAAAVWSRAGELDHALHCLEYGLCSLPADVVDKEHGYWAAHEQPGYLQTDDIRRLFPADSPTLRDWFLAADDALRSWFDEGRLQPDSTGRGLVILALRLHALGEADRALDLIRWLAAHDGMTGRSRLWVADAARRISAPDLADSIERTLYDERQLHLERLHEVVRRELDASGPESALALGELAISYTLHRELIAVLVEAAERTGDAETIARWTALQEARDAAEARLEEIDAEDERRRASGK